MNCYITGTGSFLPGEAVPNEAIPDFMGELDGEALVRRKILRMNGIKSRHYALDRAQNPTHDVYEMAALAAARCLDNKTGANWIFSQRRKEPTLLRVGRLPMRSASWSQ